MSVLEVIGIYCNILIVIVIDKDFGFNVFFIYIILLGDDDCIFFIYFNGIIYNFKEFDCEKKSFYFFIILVRDKVVLILV